MSRMTIFSNSHMNEKSFFLDVAADLNKKS